MTHCEVKITGHRQLLVTLDDGSDTCTLRFFSFYPAQQQALAVGKLIRARAATRKWRDGEHAARRYLIKPVDRL